jgi:leader peptidase (prepilin peptidase)/N-methyltransferase
VILAELPHWFLVAVAVALGLAFGSFLNVVIYRWPRGQSLARPGSRCPGCGTPIAAYDNIPVLSWLILRGKARCCGARIGARYPLVELIGGLLGWALVETHIATLALDTPAWQVALLLVIHLALGLGLVAAAFIDLEHLLLPDGVTIGGTLLGLATVPVRMDIDWFDAAFGAVLGFVIVWLPFDLLYRALRGQPGMGLGDAKLVMLAGAWFGWPGAVFTLFAGAVQGTAVTLALFAASGRAEESESVRNERARMLAELEATPEAERAELQAELDKDPLFREPAAGISQVRLAFGPFLVLATLEYLLFGPALESYLFGLAVAAPAVGLVLPLSLAAQVGGVA